MFVVENLANIWLISTVFIGIVLWIALSALQDTTVKNNKTEKKKVFDGLYYYRSCKYYPGKGYATCANHTGTDPEYGMCNLCERNPYSDYYKESR